MTGWVMLVVLTNGLSQSTAEAFYPFATEAECKQAAASTVAVKDRWICFNTGN